MMSNVKLGVAGVVFACGMALVSGCASGGSTLRSGATEENAVVHVVTKEDEAATHSKEPVTSASVVLWVNGLGCPQCATNADKQLERLRGVASIRTDLGTGKIHVGLAGDRKPSPHQFSEAMLDAGFTLVKMEQ
jgi:copper chaperone CopZ